MTKQRECMCGVLDETGSFSIDLNCTKCVTPEPVESWKDTIVKTWFIYDLTRNTPAGAEKELVAFVEAEIASQKQKQIEEFVSMLEERESELREEHTKQEQDEGIGDPHTLTRLFEAKKIRYDIINKLQEE